MPQHCQDEGDAERVEVGGQAWVGVVGHGDNTVNMITPRRATTWPVIVGSPPPLASAFQARHEILDAMAGDRGVVLRQVMSGDGGVGKSQIAAGLVQDSDADLRVWVQGESRAAILTAYAEAAVRLDLADRDIGPETLAACCLGFLASTDKRWLVVIDDLADPADMKGLWPAGGGGLIVTTRRRDGALSAGGRRVIDVGVYTPFEAEAYLTERLTPLTDQLPQDVLAQGGDLARDLGYLPLGLAQAAAVIIDQGISCEKYQSWFADRARSLDDLFPADAATDGYARTVATTWALAIAAANQLDPRGLALPLAYLITVCDPVGAPENLFTSNTSCRYLAALLDQEEAIPADQARRALRALHRLSLINHNTQNIDSRAVRMHNLTARAILQTLDQDDLAILVQCTATALIEIWPKIEKDTALADALRANTEALTRLAPNALWNDETGGHPVLFRTGQSLQDAGLADLALAYYEDLAADAGTRLGPDDPYTLSTRNNLAYAYKSAGRVEEALTRFEQLLPDRIRVQGANDLGSLITRDNLALAYLDAGRIEEAVTKLDELLDDMLRVLGPDDPDTLTTRNNLALALKDAGRVEEAVAEYEQLLVDRMRLLGADAPDTLITRNNLASAHTVVGRVQEAVIELEQLLPNIERVLGADARATLTARYNLGLAYYDAGRVQEAITRFEQLLPDLMRVLGAEAPVTLHAQAALAKGYRAVGRHEDAARLLSVRA
jgi:tetratricopeptide (TPR) repeat protein